MWYLYLKRRSEKNCVYSHNTRVCIKHTRTRLIYIKINQYIKMLITDSRGYTCSFYSSITLFEILIKSWEKNTRGYHPHILPYLSNLHVQISSLSWLTDQQLTPKARLAAGTGQGLSLPGKMGYTKCMWLKGWVRTLKQGRLKLKFWLSYFLAVWFKNLVYLCFSLFSSIKM